MRAAWTDIVSSGAYQNCLIREMALLKRCLSRGAYGGVSVFFLPQILFSISPRIFLLPGCLESARVLAPELVGQRALLAGTNGTRLDDLRRH